MNAVNIATNATATAISTSSGAFLLAGLPVGVYTVTVSKSGFQTVTEANIPVAAAADRGVGAIKLPVGSASTTVEVTAATPLLETTQAQISNTFSNTQLTEFPGLTANAGLDNMVVYLPGINASRDLTFTNTNGPGFTSQGLRGRNNDQQIDGQNNNDNSVGGPTVFVSSPLFVDQYQVISNNFGPEYGRNSGTVINEITKSGTNQWHGTLVGTESNNFVNALSNNQKVFARLNGPPRFNDEFTGGSIGGPIWKDHVFVFGGFDDEIVSSTGVFLGAGPAPDASGLGTLSTCFPTSTAVQAIEKISPFAVGSAIAEPRTTVQVPLSGCSSASTFEAATPERVLPDGSHEYDMDYRVDAVVNSNDRFFGRYLLQKTVVFNAQFNGGDAAAGYPVNVPALTQSILLDETHTFTSSMVNDFRVSFGRANIAFAGNTLGNTVPLSGGLTNAIARISFDPATAPGGLTFASFGPPTNAPQSRIIGTWQGQDNWSYFRGKSEWTAGVNFTYQRSINAFFPFINGAFEFPDYSTLASNTPDQVSIGTGNPILDFRENDLFLYAGNNYKLKDNLTLNLGLTWSYFGSPENLFHQLSTANETGPNPLFTPTLPLSIRTNPEINSQKNLFGPGVGFAWTPRILGRLMGNGATVIRGGYRLAYDPSFYNPFLNVSTSSPLVLLNSVTGAGAAAFPLPANPTGSVNRVALAAALPVGTTDPRATNQTVLSPTYRPDRTQEWSLGLQRQVNSHLVVESRYVGNHGQDLFQSVNLNPLVSGFAANFPNLVPAGVTPCPASQAVVPNAVGRENCNLGIVDQVNNDGYSDFEGWENEVRTNNLFNQLTIIGNYTWSKTTDNTSEIFSTFAGGNTYSISQNPFNVTSSEHGLSGLDFPNQFTVQGYWNVPLYKSQRGVLGHALGGWSVGVAYQLVSGQTYTPDQFFLNTFTGGGVFDTAFDHSGVGTGSFETARPFFGNPSAPASQVGIFAGDACAFDANVFGVTSSACGLSPSSLISFNAFNTTGAVNPVSKSQVRFIANGAEADTLFGTPFGNVPRNEGRDYHTNLTNISVLRTFKFSERVNVQARLDMLNAFNHPNFGSVDPILEDAGVVAAGTGFANFLVQASNPRVIKAGLQINF